jgi:REP element-mobilizing transposase RayT
MANDRHWFLTWHTYGTWLPGNSAGFVSPTRDRDGSQTILNVPGTTPNADQPHLERWSREHLKAEAIRLTRKQAQELAEQLHETAAFRRWTLLAFAIVPNHVHLVVGVVGDPEPTKLLNDFKSYATRRLNSGWTTPENGTWWTESGSKRKLPDENSILGAVRYTVEQEAALVIWTSAFPEMSLAGGYLQR